jgi:hypothetical protein
VAVTLTEYDLTATTDQLGRFRCQVPAHPGTMVELVTSSSGHRDWRDYAAAGTTGIGIIMEPRKP